MKNRIILFIAGCCALVLSSCLGSDSTNYELSKDCQILSFSLSNDSIEGLSDVVFTIDQLNGKIFNLDSMPYGTVIDEKVLCDMTLASTVYSCQAIQLATGDTLKWTGKEDSLDFTKPVKFINTLWDGTTTKVYLAQINIHQVNPDSMVWSLYGQNVVNEPIKDEKVVVVDNNGNDYYYMYVLTASNPEYQLFTSSVNDGKNWAKVSVQGLPGGKAILSQLTQFEDVFYVATTEGKLYSSVDGRNWTLQSETPVVKYIMGALNTSDDFTSNGRQAPALSAIIEKDGTLLFASMDTANVWKEGVEVYNGFPVSGFASTSFNSMYRRRLMVVAGRDKNNSLTNLSWSSEDGLKWALISDEEYEPFDKQEGMSVASYDGGFLLIGGINSSGVASKSIYLSKDGGLTWNASDSLVVMPTDFVARGFASISVDKNNFMYLFGGKEQSNKNVMDQIWRGRINRLGFPNQ